jgi:dynein heavy chain 2
MDKNSTAQKLKFQDIIDSVPTMIKKDVSMKIKELAERAQGEVTIREAINELKLWCDTTEFILTMHDSNGR